MEFSLLAILLVAAAACASVARLLRQPTIVGYIFAGFLLATFGVAQNIEVFSGLSQVGVALLLFLVGIEMNLGDFAKIGKVAFLAGFGQVIFTTIVGFILATVLGFPPLAAVYMAVALTFSSTIVVVKLLSEKKDLGSLYGKISLGVLLVQDFVAVVIVMFLAGVRGGALKPSDFLIIGIKGVILLVATWILSKKVLPQIFDKFLAKNHELLFIGSIAWALGVSAFVGGPLGFTLEIGGFLAGLALSNLPEHLQIASRTKPLRDFFLTIFFLLLGTHLDITSIGPLMIPAIVFSVYVLIGNPIILTAVLGALGHTKRTSFMAGITMAQISEFSLILVTMGLALGHLGQSDVSLLIIVSVITMTGSTYLMMGANKIYAKIKNYLSIFERKKPTESVVNVQRELSGHVVVVGGDRTGKSVIKYLAKKNIPFVVVDFNPSVFALLNAERIPVIFGDISDPDIFELAGVAKARLVISSVSDLVDNMALLENLRNVQTKPITIFTTKERQDGLRLYEKGADYVIVPQRIAGEHIRHILSTYGFSSERIGKLGKANFHRLMS